MAAAVCHDVNEDIAAMELSALRLGLPLADTVRDCDRLSRGELLDEGLFEELVVALLEAVSTLLREPIPVSDNEPVALTVELAHGDCVIGCDAIGDSLVNALDEEDAVGMGLCDQVKSGVKLALEVIVARELRVTELETDDDPLMDGEPLGARDALADRDAFALREARGLSLGVKEDSRDDELVEDATAEALC